YADWCAPCKAIGPHYEQLSAQLSRSQKVTFAKVNTDHQQEIAQRYGVTALPTFMIFKNNQTVSTIRGPDATQLSDAIKKIAAEADSDGAGGFGEASGNGSRWLGADLPRGYTDVTEEVDVQGLDLLNANSELGGARTFFQESRPSVLNGKSKASTKEGVKDWVESDTDEQLMLFIPFRATLKIHSLQITSKPQIPSEVDTEAADIPMRPRTIQVYTNRAHVLGFEEAEDVPATQSITLRPSDWSAETATSRIDLRFVKFQNVTSLVLFVVDGDGQSDKVRIDRIRIIGEIGEKRELGKLEKIGDQAGE
ncbi:MAG: hypothetical protein Q9191_003409, partial [Dirinaria sp. TL-2023a]